MKPSSVSKEKKEDRPSQPRRANYGATASAAVPVAQRSYSMPVRSTRVVYYRRPGKQLTVSQQSVKLAEQARKHFFHGSFTSAHGAVFTVPNRAQQLATQLPSEMSTLSRNNSVTRRPGSRAPSAVRKPQPPRQPYSQTAVPQASALKKSTEPPLRRPDESLFSQTIVIKRRAYSADSRPTGHDRDGVLSFNGSFAVPEPPPKIQFKESAPDIDSVKAMRETSQEKKPMLSSTTIERARRALKKFEERKVTMPRGSFSEADQVDLGAVVMPTLKATPLVLVDREASNARRVVINSDAEEQVSNEFEESDEEDVGEEVPVSFCSAFMDLVYLGVPAAVTICFTFAMSVIPLAFVGSMLGERELTGASVGYFITCIIVLYPMIGLTFAMDTLCSHEFGRDPLSPEMGLVLQRGVIINMIMLLPMCVGIYFLDIILVPVYGANVAKVAEEFLLFSPLYLIPDMLFIAFTKFLNNQMLPHIPMIALTAGTILSPILQYQLTPLGVRYTMVGMAISAWFQFFVVVVIILFKPETRITLGTLRLRDALEWSDVKEYMKLAIPSAIFVAAEASSFDLSVLLCAQFTEADGAAWSAIMNSLFIFASFSGGLSASACANIGRCIGANLPKSAKRYVLVSIVFAFVLGLLDSVVLVTFFNTLMSLFGTREKTLQIAREVLFILPFFHVADSVQFTFQGIFSGLGKNHLGAVILLTSLWGIGIPLSFLLGQFLGYRMFGVCVGLTIGLCIEAPVMVVTGSSMNYEKICEDFVGDEESDEEEESEESEEDEERDEEYVEEVMRRSGISTSSAEFDEEYAEHYKRLLPPKRRRHRKVIHVDDDDDDV